MDRRTIGGGILLSAAALVAGLTGVEPQISQKGLPRTLENTYGQILESAQHKSGADLATAVTDLSGIPSNSQHFPAAVELQEVWSKDLLGKALKEFRQARFSALSTLRSIPEGVSVFEQAQVLLSDWTQQFEEYNQAVAATDRGDWQTALAHINALRSSDLFLSPVVQELTQSVIVNANSPETPNIAASVGQSPPPAFLPLSPVSYPLQFRPQVISGSQAISASVPRLPSAQSSSSAQHLPVVQPKIEQVDFQQSEPEPGSESEFATTYDHEVAQTELDTDMEPTVAASAPLPAPVAVHYVLAVKPQPDSVASSHAFATQVGIELSKPDPQLIATDQQPEEAITAEESWTHSPDLVAAHPEEPVVVEPEESWTHSPDLTLAKVEPGEIPLEIQEIVEASETTNYAVLGTPSRSVDMRDSANIF